MPNLTTHFSLDEFCRTNTGLYNIPEEAEIQRLFYLCTFLLEPIRERWGEYVINSGYRSEAVNTAVGGSPTSQHLTGEACDGGPKVANIDKVFDWIVTESGLKYGQAILEQVNDIRWIHLSLPRPHKVNRVALVYGGTSYQTYHSA